MSDAVWPRSRLVAVCRRILAAAARQIPFYRRSAWLAEWEGELWALQRDGASQRVLLRYAVGVWLESHRERRRERGRMRGLAQDIRHAVRRLVRTPVFTLVSVLVLALGIGANASLFSAMKAVLLSRPPYPDAERLVSLDLLLSPRADAPQDTMPWSYPKFDLARTELRQIESVSAYAARTGTLTGSGDAARIGVEYVTPSYFALLGVRAATGRLFGETEEYPSPGAVVVLSQGLWATRFGSDPAMLGRTVTIDGTSFEIVGVAPAWFRGISGSADVFVPVAALATMRGARRITNPWSHWLRAIGRLRAGESLEQARTEASGLGAMLTRTYPDPSGGGRHGVALVPFLDARVNPVTRLAVTAVSVGGVLLLLIACANMAGLMLARSAARRTDVAVRAAMGAGRGRLAREFMLEGLILALAGGVLGVLIALGGTRIVAGAVNSALNLTGTRGIQFLEPAALEASGWVLAAGIALAVLTGVLFGLVPARAASRPDLTVDLRAGARAVGDQWRGASGAGRVLLVAGQLALTLVLLAGAGLMAASFARLSAIDPGYTNDDVLTLAFERGPGPTLEEDRLFETELLERVSAIPGVAGAAVAPCPPLSGHCEVLGLRQIDDQSPIDYGDMEPMLGYAVSDDYFATLGIATLEGRTFGPADGPGSRPVAVINRAAAQQYFAGTSAIGHRIGVTHALTEDQLAEIVGVVTDVRYGNLEQAAIPAIYFSRQQAPTSYGTLMVAAVADPFALVDAVRREAVAIDPGMPLYSITTMAERRAVATARTRIVLGLLVAFAVAGLLLSAVGLYGVVSVTVARRTREMGLRLALGAAARDVVRLVVAPPVLLALGGAAAGVFAAAFLTRFATALLYGVEPSDPRVLALSVIVLLAVALAAAWIPARRATRVDPAVALRND